MEILDLIDKRNFEEVLSLCYAKMLLNQMKLQKYLGDYERWDVSIYIVIKNLPSSIFEPADWNEFFNTIYAILPKLDGN